MGRIIRSTLSIDDRYLLTYTRQVKEIYVLELENFNIRRSSAIEYDCHFLFVRYSRDTWNTWDPETRFLADKPMMAEAILHEQPFKCISPLQFRQLIIKRWFAGTQTSFRPMKFNGIRFKSGINFFASSRSRWWLSTIVQDCPRLPKIAQDCPRSSISTILFVSDHADRDLANEN